MQRGLLKNFVKDEMCIRDRLSAKMAPPVGIDDPYRYRNKAQFPVGRDKDGNIITGFYASRSHNIIPVEDVYKRQSLCRMI